MQVKPFTQEIVPTPTQDNNALLKYPYGNTIFAIATFSLYLFLMTIFFAWDKLFQDDGSICTICKRICPPCRNPCSKPQSEEPNPSTAADDENNEEDDEQSVNDQDPEAAIPDLGRDEATDEVSIPLMPLKDRTSPDQLSEASLPASPSSPSKEVVLSLP